jgi:hypothetical protein
MKSRIFIVLAFCVLLAFPNLAFSQTKKTTAKKTTTKTTTTKTPAKTTTPSAPQSSSPNVGQPAPQQPTPQQPAPQQPLAPQSSSASSPFDISPTLASNGLKEALTKGIQKGVELVSKPDGFLGNSLIRIPFPPELKMVEDGVRKIGLSKVADDAVTSMNRAAEQAAADALPIFLEAIRQLTFNDVLSILNGTNDRAATDFLQRTTSSQLTQKFKPTIADALNKVEATKHWQQIIEAYNKIPFVQRVNPDLPQYVTERAIAGLFTMVAQEERAIRKDPVARTSDVLQQVFGGIGKSGGK